MQDPGNDFTIVHGGVRCAGLHLFVDLYGVSPDLLKDEDYIKATFEECVRECNATLLHMHAHVFEKNGGISCTAILAESHISTHTWPELGYAALDIFMCGKANPEAALPVLGARFKPERHKVDIKRRGEDIGR